MMGWSKRAAGLWVGLGILLLGVRVLAQDTGRPLVVFVLDNTLQAAAFNDPGPDGVSALNDIFRALGAETRFIRLNQAIPDAARVVVLARPLRAIPAHYLARIWRHLNRGNHLLLAIDPVGYTSTRTERGTGSFSALLGADYGVSFQDTFLAQTWFDQAALSDLRASSIFMSASLPHPVTAPLLRYDLPVMTWGARTVRVDALGIDSAGLPLLFTETSYAESDRNVFSATTPSRLALNLPVDQIGHLVMAGLGENSKTGARVAVLGDSELLQNGFGLRPSAGASGGPLFPGNRILTERLAAWLLGLPLENYPPLPAGFTWLVVDGDGQDWPERVPMTDSGGAGGVRVFHNDSYLYLLLQPTEPAQTPEPLRLRFGGVTITADSTGVFISTGAETRPVPDAAFAAGQFLELRLPLRVTGMRQTLAVDELCYGQNCAGAALPVMAVAERDPVPLRLPTGPLATIGSPNSRVVNLRTGPGTNFDAAAVLENGLVFAALGRDSSATWVWVENARYSGWLARTVVVLNTSIANLPVRE